MERLRSALAAIEPILAGITFLPETTDAAAHAERLAVVRRLFDGRLHPRDARARAPLVAVMGGTNVGKSTIANLLLDEPLGLPCATAVGTKSAALSCPTDELDRYRSERFLPWFEKLAWRGLEALNEPFEGDRPRLYLRARDHAPRVTIVDTPDIDATLERNHRTSLAIFVLADAVIFVTTPQKYNDEVCVELLRRAALFRKAVLAVFNHGEEESEACQDFRTAVLERVGLADTPVVAVPHLADPSAAGPWREALRERLAAWAADGPRLVQRADLGAAVGFAAEFEGVIDELSAEVDAVRGYLKRVGRAAEQEGDRYAAALPALPQDVLDEAVLDVLRELRVPVLDSLYERLGRLLAPVRLAGRQAWTVLVRQLGLHGRDLAIVEAEWREQEYQRAREGLERLHWRLREQLAEAPAALRPALAARLPSLTDDTAKAAATAFVERSEALRRELVAEARAAILGALQEKRWQITGLKLVKAAARGTAMYLVIHTGGLSGEDLALAPAADAVCRAVIDHVIGRRSREELERAVAAGRRRRFVEFLVESALSPLERALPECHRDEFVSAAREAARVVAEAAREELER